MQGKEKAIYRIGLLICLMAVIVAGTMMYVKWQEDSQQEEWLLV